MSRAAFQRILFVIGLTIAAFGVYLASRTSTGFKWDSIVAIAIIAVGVYAVIVGMLLMLQTALTPEEEQQRMVLPEVSIPLLYGGFIGVIAVGAGLVAGHYIGRTEGVMTFIFAFVVANLLFGLPLALARSGSARG